MSAGGPSTPAELFDLSGRVAIVTGGTRGLGREIVLAFAAAGADVVVSSRKQEACEAVAEEVRALGREALSHACHVGSWEQVDALADAAFEHFGKVDVLVNNAGIAPLYPDPLGLTEELWDKTIAVNVKGPYRLTAKVGTRMAEGDGGSVINVSSVGATLVRGDSLPYGAAKAGLNALTIGFAEAFGPKVRVNCIMPGPFATDISDNWDWEAFEHSARAFPLRRAGQPREIVGTALYFASDASSYTTGTVLPIDGGQSTARPDSGDAAAAFTKEERPA
jgi:NAD(P)-dependent dehydrogenase (short-subunit alcohol dehydrogenase family)